MRLVFTALCPQRAVEDDGSTFIDKPEAQNEMATTTWFFTPMHPKLRISCQSGPAIAEDDMVGNTTRGPGAQESHNIRN